MKVAMGDPSLFTGRYDDSLCAALAEQGAQVTLLGRPMRATDAIVPQGYRYRPHFFRRSEALRDRLGEGRAFRLAKAADHALACARGDLRPLAMADIVHVQWLPRAPAAAEAVILERTADRIADCWAMMAAQLSAGDYLLGAQMTMLDLFVAVVSRWTPGRLRFYEVAPGLAGPVRRTDEDPRLAALWAERFPAGEAG